jgi:hypothetical protein
VILSSIRLTVTTLPATLSVIFFVFIPLLSDTSLHFNRRFVTWLGRFSNTLFATGSADQVVAALRGRGSGLVT